MRTVVRNSFARHTVTAERVPANGRSCTECGCIRGTADRRTEPARVLRPWLYVFHVDDDQGPRHSGPIANGRPFCSRGCAESYIGRSFDETK